MEKFNKETTQDGIGSQGNQTQPHLKGLITFYNIEENVKMLTDRRTE